MDILRLGIVLLVVGIGLFFFDRYDNQKIHFETTSKLVTTIQNNKGYC
jgi:hypothetical protein